MKIIAIIAVCFAFAFNLSGQVDMQNKTDSYTINGVDYHVITFTFHNNLSDSTIIWLSDEDISHFDDTQKIKSYFLKVKGDFSLLNLINDQLIKKSDTPIVFNTFLKILVPSETFNVTVICKGNDIGKSSKALNEFIKKHFVGIEMKKISFISNIKQHDYPFYTSDSLVLTDQIFYD